MLDDIRELCRPFAGRDAANGDAYPWDNVADLLRAGVHAAPFPASLGGRGMSLVDATKAMEIVAAASPSTALLIAMPLGLAGVLTGTVAAAPHDERGDAEAQVERIAAEFREKKIYAACNSERGAGGSLAATKTTARRDATGAIRLDGEKILASFGRHADFFFSTAKQEDDTVEFFILDAHAPGVEVASDWDGFGMRSTESHSVRLTGVIAREQLGWPGFLDGARPTAWWWCIFAAIPLGCAASILRAVGAEAKSGAVRQRCSDALMRIEALRAYLHDTAARWRPGGSRELEARMLRTKTYVSQEATRLCGELFALSGGRHYARTGAVARALADAFAGTALRPPLPLALETLAETFTTAALDEP